MSVNPRDKLQDLVEDFRDAMLVTKDAQGDLQARPMHVAEHDEESGTVVFASSILSEKVDELQKDPSVCVSFQGGAKYVSLTGTVTIDQDREKIRALYNTAWKLWFPEGPEQSDICLIRFHPVVGEYWDNSGTEGLSFAWNAAKAIVSGKGMNPAADTDKHAETAV